MNDKCHCYGSVSGLVTPSDCPIHGSEAARGVTLEMNAGELDGQSLIDMNNLAVGYLQPRAASGGALSVEPKMSERTGKHNRGHRVDCPSDVPEGWYGFCCSCEWLDRIDKEKSEAGFHWSEGVYFKRLANGSTSIRIFGSYNGYPNWRDLVIPPNEWASIVSSVCSQGETAETYSTALDFHNAALAAHDQKVREQVLEEAARDFDRLDGNWSPPQVAERLRALASRAEESDNGKT